MGALVVCVPGIPVFQGQKITLHVQLSCKAAKLGQPAEVTLPFLNTLLVGVLTHAQLATSSTSRPASPPPEFANYANPEIRKEGTINFYNPLSAAAGAILHQPSVSARSISAACCE